MFQNRTKLFIQTALLITCLCFVLGLKTETQSIGVGNAVNYFKAGTLEFSRASLELKKAIALLSKDPASLSAARIALINSRMSYKKIAFFMDYFFESSSLIYNKPAKVEVEEPYMEYQEPSGFQVMEAMLFDDDPSVHKQSLQEQADLLLSSAADLNSLLYGFEANDKQLLESVRLELVRVITLSITGYDAPELKSGIMESRQSIRSISNVLEPFYGTSQLATATTLRKIISGTLLYLQEHPDFDTFNRMEFLTVYALPMQEQLRDFIHDAQLDLNDKSVLNYTAKNIFDTEALVPQSFPAATAANKAKTALGKKLFFENSLSGNLKRSCASCHRPEQYFTDGLTTSLAFDGTSHVQRNAPTLIYAGFQYSQFWDGRASGLPQQIRTVIANPLEMNGDHQVIMNELRKREDYVAAFKRAFPGIASRASISSAGTTSETVTLDNLANALSAYVMSLAPRNSAFDRYIGGDKKAMTIEQVQGFNLFMGKAQCGSCHFAPLFNGLIPPLYKLTEYEILGTPANDDFTRLKKDTDRGRRDFFPISYYEAAFKTPTVRNVEMTAPYMHNGVFKDLEKVVQFYNLGGGAGLHLDLPQQTLSAKPLHLSDKEVHEIVLFMNSLTDKLE